MQLKFIQWKFVAPVLALLVVCGCNRSSVKEPPITGKATDGAVSMTVRWQEGRRYIFRVETVTSSQIPRKNTAQLIQTETMLAQDLAFAITNVAPDGSRTLQMEVLAVQLETGRDDGLTTSFDSGNRVMQVEDTPLVQRLRKFVGLKLTFRLSAESKILRMDGMREFSDRSSGGGTVRGVAGGIIARYFNPQFFRDIVEMGMLPKEPVRIGDTWKASRQMNTGVSGGGVPMEFTYHFRGWQRHGGTNCARIDFTGVFNPNAPLRTNDSVVGRIVKAAVAPNIEEGNIIGKAWYDPEVFLAVETILEQTITTKSMTGRRVRSKAGTNTVEEIELSGATNAPPGPGKAPAQNVTPITTSTHQYTNIKLLEIEPLEK